MSAERRFHPRKNVSFDVEVCLPDQQSFTVQATNLSFSGIQISANKLINDTILSSCGHPAQMILNLKASEHINGLSARLIVNRRTSHDAFLLGLKFINVSSEHQQLLLKLV